MSTRKGTRSSGRQASIDANSTTDSVSKSSAIKGKSGRTKSASADNATVGRLSKKRTKDPSGMPETADKVSMKRRSLSSTGGISLIII